MLSFWPFAPWASRDASAEGDNHIPIIPSVVDSDALGGRMGGETARFNTDGSGTALHEVDRVRDAQLAIHRGDARVTFMDTESIDSLVRRYETEFTKAHQQMQDKVAQKKAKVIDFYNYDEDKRYQQWRQDQQAVRDHLKIHWIDTIVDKPATCLVYLARVCTTAGLFYGLGRAAYLYRTMDKMYAKLNGVTGFSIALQEVSLNVCKGAAVAVAGTAGITLGEGAFNLACIIASGDVTLPDRTWWHVWSATTSSGALSGAAFAGIHYKVFTPWGMMTVVSTFTALGTVLGFCLGYGVYRPYAETREHALYDPYWRPWYQRKIVNGGGANMRGRYM